MPANPAPGKSPIIAPPLHYEMIRANGLNFRVATAGTGKKLALLLHGFPEFSYSWRHQIPLLAELGYRVWAPDMRGYGGSDAPAGVKNYRISELLKDIGALIDVSGAESVALVGHDWGAFVSWNFAMRKIRPLERLIIMNVPHPGAMERAMRSGGLYNWEQLRKSSYMFLFQIPRLPEAIALFMGNRLRTRNPASDFMTRADLDAYIANGTIPGRITTMLNYYRAMLQGDLPKIRKYGYPTIETPTLMVWGEADVALGKELTYGTEKFVRDFTIRYLPGVGHMVQQEAPVEVNTMLEAWLTGREVPQAEDLGMRRAS